jgi:hypothetical protein
MPESFAQILRVVLEAKASMIASNGSREPRRVLYGELERKNRAKPKPMLKTSNSRPKRKIKQPAKQPFGALAPDNGFWPIG